MRTYHGSCHCGAVRFEIDTDGIDSLGECNCSICHKKGALLHRVTEDRSRLIFGADALREYKLNTGIARHRFCRHCGIYGFHHPRSAPDAYQVNLRCLDDFDGDLNALEIIRFDGQNWEASFEAAKK